MPVLLEAKKLSKTYRVNKGLAGSSVVRVLKDVSFELEAGQILAVVGESGSGKSTLARQIVMLEQPDCGEILLDGKSLRFIPDVHQRIRMIFQNPAASLDPRKRVCQLLEEPLINNTGLSGSQRDKLICRALEQVGMNRDQSSLYPHMLSGGQRQRVAIARALIVNPAVIVADEAVSALDVSVQAQVLNLVMDLRDELGMSWLFITHDISVVNVIADRVMVLYDGAVMESGSVDAVLDSPAHPYTRVLLHSIPGTANFDPLFISEQVAVRDTLDSMETGCVFRQRCPIADNHCEESVPPLVTVDGRSVACFKAA